MSEFIIEKLVSGGIITNYSCTSKCAHCLYNCSPKRDKKFMDPETAQKIFFKARSLGCPSVHIGGGEPFLKPFALETILEIASSASVLIDYIETNASWYRDCDSAIEILSRLRKKGLTTLLLSISPFHNEFISYTKVEGVAAAAKQANIRILPWSSAFVEDIIQFDPKTPHRLSEYKEKFGNHYLLDILNKYWIHWGGRVLETYRPLIGNKSVERILAENSDNCAAEISDTSHFHLDLYGNYIPGLCSGLSISSDDLGKPIFKKTYPLLSILYERGIRGFYEFVKYNFETAPLNKNYINKCDLCMDLRGFVVNKTQEIYHELKPEEFYTLK